MIHTLCCELQFKPPHSSADIPGLRRYHVALLRSNLLRLTVVLSFWLRAHHAVLAIDHRIEDNDLSILYRPEQSWHSNLDSCSSCLTPGGGTSYHEAINPASDADDITKTSKTHSSTKLLPAQTTPLPLSSVHSSSVSNPSSTATEDHHRGKGDSDPSRRRSFAVFSPRTDGDDVNITLSFNFTGTLH